MMDRFCQRNATTPSEERVIEEGLRLRVRQTRLAQISEDIYCLSDADLCLVERLIRRLIH